ncbi:inositol monophosphatase family protein [Salsuginibacillus kocurii]|uniref:inositol monophosphatase family protein n=1 Tax=Salsuginibacillus kocurii TaxID=427078 RepID=UPI000365EDB5|nr:inositol monophosphatase family protein [Salsuginibacillus kocurii]
MSNQTDFHVKENAETIIKEAAKLLCTPLQDELHIQTKSDADDLVTDKDKEVEDLFRTRIAEMYPEHKMIGEEGTGSEVNANKGTVWIIDPIDGTTNFVHQHYNFVISVGIYEDGEARVGVVYDVMNDEWFSAVRGAGFFHNDKQKKMAASGPYEESIIGLNARWLISKRFPRRAEVCRHIVRDIRATRSYGAAALEMAYTACGRLDGYLTMRVSPWDYAAGKLLVEEAGGKISDIFGQSLTFEGETSLLCAASDLHGTLSTAFSQSERE